MARGNIYFITTNKDTDISFGESNYYDKLDTLHINYVKDQTPEESEILMEAFNNFMYKLGAVIEQGNPDNNLRFSFRFETVQEAKKLYFAPKLKQLQESAAALTIERVMKSAPALDYLLDNDYGDIITFNNGTEETNITLDDFVRWLEPGITYYVYNRVILIH